MSAYVAKHHVTVGAPDKDGKAERHDVPEGRVLPAHAYPEDIAGLLKAGAIQPHEPAQPKSAPKAKPEAPADTK